MMRDTYVFLIFITLILCACFLSFTKLIDAKDAFVPIVTGFLGMLAQVDRTRSGEPGDRRSLLQRIGISKAPPTLEPLVKVTDTEKDHER